uniref:28S ribosomal protein S22, mitochondrial n=1 Tax=Strigamia maritima TaxID=126957 RepID=T1IKQ4_STRMM
MASTCANSAFKRYLSRVFKSYKLNVLLTRHCSDGFSRLAILAFSEQDPAPYFFNDKVKKILTNITGLELEKAYKPKQMIPSDPEYKFVTSEELEQMIEKAKQRSKEKLQMPPVLQERKPITEVLSRDPELKGFENHKLIFTDVSYGLSDRDRLIVARDPDGTLRRASWEERDRMTRLFFPKTKCKMTMPKMFEDEFLDKVLTKKNINRACVQFEPDDPNYIRVTTKSYNHVDSTQSFDVLRSTRHFGPMAFYLTFYNKIDNLILDMVQRELIENITDLIQLFYILHPEKKQSIEFSNQIDFIRDFVKQFTNKPAYIIAALQSYQQMQQQRLETSEGIKRAHGFTD